MMKKPSDEPEYELTAEFRRGWDAALLAVTQYAQARSRLWVDQTNDLREIAQGLVMLRYFIETDVRALCSDRQDVPPSKDMRH